jgi:predicted alpha/beta superfamily hydrolase
VKIKLLAVALISLIVFTPNGLLVAQADTVPPLVQIPNTQVLRFNSAIVGQEYQLYINLPSKFSKDKGKTYPVVYLLDAQYDFPFVTGVYGGQYYDGYLPEFITVGITWGGKDPDAGSLRGRDFTPTHMEWMQQSGGGPKFLAFIKNELIPFISSKYPVTTDRTLIGSSLGGLFTLYSLYNEPSLFQRYVLTSPAAWWDNSVLEQFEKKFVEKGISSPVKLFMGIGGMEPNVAEFRKFVERLKEKQVKGLDVDSLVMENTGHSGSKPEGYARGLQWVFKKPSLMLPANLLNQYAGTYLAGKDSVHLTIENGMLTARVQGDEKMVLHAETANDFYLDGMFLKLHFKRDNGQKITGFELEQFDGSVFVKKLN